jgi:hypothetical protein
LRRKSGVPGFTVADQNSIGGLRVAENLQILLLPNRTGCRYRVEAAPDSCALTLLLAPITDNFFEKIMSFYQ